MSKYLFLFTIGPVQSFISQARKTQDLYSSSRILSELISFAITEVQTSNKRLYDNELIFPDIDSDIDNDSKPNRFIALISTDDPKGFGKRIENTVKKEFKELAEKTLQKRGLDLHTGFNDQIKSFLEVYWLAIPCESSDTDEYRLKYKKIEQGLGAVKNIRPFVQLEEQGRKCGLCGERNVLVYKPTGSGDKKKHMHNPVIIPKNSHQCIKGEGLCAVCCVKRLYEKDKKKRLFLLHLPLL